MLLSNVAYVGLKEVNKKNTNRDQDSLKPWQRYQVVKASWPAIVSQKLFDEVQKVLDENTSLERRRLKNAENRIFLLSQKLYCSECGERLHGHSAHGRSDVYRHYTHAEKAQNVKCSFKRVRADKLEEVLVKHLTATIWKAGYLETIEKKLTEAIQEEPLVLKDRLEKVQKEISSVDLEISSIIKTQAQLKSSISIQLMEEELEKLDQKRKSLFAQLQEVDGSLNGLQGTSQIIGDLKERLEFFKKGFSKAPPAVKRRMLRSVIGEISYKPGRIELAYHLSESRNNNVVSIDRAKNMKKREILGATEPPALPLRAAGSDLSLSFANLRDGKNGCEITSTRNKSIAHDIIEVFENRQLGICEISVPLYLEGLSITDIALRTGFKRTSIWKALKTYRDGLQPKKEVPYARWRQGHRRTGARPPFGFSLLEGEVVRDPKEYPTLLLIHKLWTTGSAIMSILQALSDKKLKSRTGRDWSYGVIKSIGKRIDAKDLVMKAGKLGLSEEFLNGALPTKTNSKQRKERKL